MQDPKAGYERRERRCKCLKADGPKFCYGSISALGATASCHKHGSEFLRMSDR